MPRRKKNLRAVLNNEEEPTKQTELSDDEVVQIFQEMHAEADEAYRPQKDIADVAWNAYNNEFDFSDKGEGQSKAFIPVYKSAIRVAKSIIRKSLLSAPQYFTIEGLTKESRELEADIEDGLYRLAEQGSFREHVATAAFGGMLENLGVLKVFPTSITDEDEIISEQQEVKVVYAPVSVPNDFRLDPTGRNLYTLHRTEMDLCDYELLVDSGDYTKSSLDAAKAGFMAADEEFRKLREQKMSDAAPPPWRKMIELWEVWTRALVRADGTAIQRNVMFTVLNKKHLARKVTPYLYRHGKPPFAWSPVADKPFSVYHENFGEPVLGMLDGIIDLMDSLVDAARNVATKGFEIQLDQVRNPGEISRGIYGGKVIKVAAPPIPGYSAVRPFDVGTFSPDALQFLSWMLNQFQNGIGVTELLSGIPGVGEKTATEIQSKTRAAMGNLNEVAVLLEDHLVAPALRMTYQLALEWNPEIFGERLAFQTDKRKLKFKCHVRGISGTMEREGELQKLLMVMQTLGQTPVAPRLNWDYIASELLLKNGLKPQDFLNAQVSQPPEVGQGMTPPQMEAAAAQQPAMMQALQGLQG